MPAARRHPLHLAALRATTSDTTRNGRGLSQQGLADEARYLAVVLASLLDDAEASGFASLISIAASRAAAREAEGVFVPLEEQDMTR